MPLSANKLSFVFPSGFSFSVYVCIFAQIVEMMFGIDGSVQKSTDKQADCFEVSAQISAGAAKLEQGSRLKKYQNCAQSFTVS